MGNDVSFNTSLSQNFRFLGQAIQTLQLSDTRTWSLNEGINYALWRGLSIGLSASFTYDDVAIGTDMTSENLQGQINWQPGSKLMFAFSGGLEDRQFLKTARPDSVSPIFSLSLIYRLFEVTTITLSANRGVSASYFQNQITESTGFNVSVHQRLFEKLSLDVGGGYGTTQYKGTTTALAPNRQDNHTSFNARLSYPFFTRGSIGVFYDWSDNPSTGAGFTYSSTQAGMEVGYHF
jgi:uncharacterized protein (PEP-CTERM system associated)